VFGQPGSADVVLTFRNVHNWVMADTAPAMFKAFYAVLRPGGVLGVVDHRADDAASLASVKQSGYLPTRYVEKLATDAGFTLDASSEINANPKDTKNYPKGVWTLPPTLTLGEQDKAKYLAIGESDRMTLRFIKPAAPASAASAH
jgi:predicted methyltransferase